MADKRFYWIKLKQEFFNGDDMDFLMTQPNGSQYIVLYLMLCMKAANTNGKLMSNVGEMIIPYDVQKIVRETKYFDADTVTVALELYKGLGLVYRDENGVLTIQHIDEMVGSESPSAKRMRDHRASQCDKNVTHNVTQEIRDKSIEYRDKDIRDRDKSIDIYNIYNSQVLSDTHTTPTTTPKKPSSTTTVLNMYREICQSLPGVRTMTAARERHINARLNQGFTIDDFRKVFEAAEASPFCKGQNSHGWKANFDWLIEERGFVNVLEGKYGKGSNVDVKADIPRKIDFRLYEDSKGRFHTEYETRGNEFIVTRRYNDGNVVTEKYDKDNLPAWLG